MKSENWKEKLKAFMEGLEVENIEIFLSQANILDYRRLGEIISERIKDLKKNKLRDKLKKK